MVLFADVPVSTVLLVALVLVCPLMMRSMGGDQAGHQRHQMLEHDRMPALSRGPARGSPGDRGHCQGAGY